MSVKVAGHRLHPSLVAFPIGLLGGSVIFDVIWLVTKTERWADVAFCTLSVGIVTGLLAAPFGSIDWLDIPRGTRAKTVGLLHGMIAFLSIALFAVSWWFRHESPTSPEMTSIALSFGAIVLLSVAGWLGGELVERLGIGVDTGAHPNSPSSLSGRAAHESVLATTDNLDERTIVDAARSTS